MPPDDDIDDLRTAIASLTARVEHLERAGIERSGAAVRSPPLSPPSTPRDVRAVESRLGGSGPLASASSALSPAWPSSSPRLRPDGPGAQGGAGYPSRSPWRASAAGSCAATRRSAASSSPADSASATTRRTRSTTCRRSSLIEGSWPAQRSRAGQGLFPTWDAYFDQGKAFVEKSDAAWFDSSTQMFNAMANQLSVASPTPTTSW